MIVDKGTVNRGELPLDPLLARYGDYWRLSSTGRGDQALVRTDEAREIRGARGKRSARPEFFTLHRALGLKQKSSYHHGLEKHCTARIIFLEKHFPAILRKNFTVKSKNMRINWCTLHREPTKTVSDELNSSFYVTREWSIRLLHFPDTMHVRRLEKCGACGAFEDWLDVVYDLSLIHI